MKADQLVSSHEWIREKQSFSLVQGGPLFQLLLRTKLSNDALFLLKRRIIAISAFCWLPILLFSAMEGNLLKGVAVPFLFDFDIHVRFLVSVPLLIAAEFMVHQRMQPLIKQFLTRKLIPEQDLDRFYAAIDAALRLRNSATIELMMLFLVYVIGILYVWPQYIALDTATWYAKVSVEASSLSLAGKWFAFVSLPVFQFLLLRWYFRLFIWARLLWRVSRIKMSILPTHPDGVGGLGFLGGQVIGFAPVLMAHGALLGGLIANRIFYRGAILKDFYLEIAVLVGFLMGIVFLPLLVFTPQLERARIKGVGEYGVLAARYMREFDEKWLRGGAQENEELIGSSDIQSLADMGNSFAFVKSMSILPFSKGVVMQLIVLTLIPMLPLALTMMPLEELLKALFGMIM